MWPTSARQFGVLSLLLTAALVGCDDSPTNPPEQTPAAIEVEPEQVVLTSVGEQAELTATVYDEGGEQISNAEVSWSSSDEAVATVDESGVVEAVGEGTATVQAESGDVSTEVDVSVELDA